MLVVLPALEPVHSDEAGQQAVIRTCTGQHCIANLRPSTVVLLLFDPILPISEVCFYEKAQFLKLTHAFSYLVQQQNDLVFLLD